MFLCFCELWVFCWDIYICRQGWNPSPIRTRVCIFSRAFPGGAPAPFLKRSRDWKNLRVSSGEGLGTECPIPGAQLLLRMNEVLRNHVAGHLGLQVPPWPWEWISTLPASIWFLKLIWWVLRFLAVCPQTSTGDKEEKGASWWGVEYVWVCVQSRGTCRSFWFGTHCVCGFTACSFWPLRIFPAWFKHLGLGIQWVKRITHSHAKHSHMQETPCRSHISWGSVGNRVHQVIFWAWGGVRWREEGFDLTFKREYYLQTELLKRGRINAPGSTQVHLLLSETSFLLLRRSSPPSSFKPLYHQNGKIKIGHRRFQKPGSDSRILPDYFCNIIHLLS